MRDFKSTKTYGDRPILFTEFGVRSVHGCIQNPWEILFTTYYDGEEQANYMAAGVEVFKEVPYWMGFCWWKWDEVQNRPQYHYEEGDGGFTIQGKPAEKVFRDLTLYRE